MEMTRIIVNGILNLKINLRFVVFFDEIYSFSNVIRVGWELLLVVIPDVIYLKRLQRRSVVVKCQSVLICLSEI